MKLRSVRGTHDLYGETIKKYNEIEKLVTKKAELNSFNNLLVKHKKLIMKRNKDVTGFNIGMNNGEDAGQTIYHCHIHLIPRRKGDIKNPRGGIRGVIPEKKEY